MPKQRYFIQLSYNGTNYHGWQVQPNAVTVQEVLNKCLATVLRQPVDTVGCGRTDTGVHAREFFAHFDMEDVEVKKTIDHGPWSIERQGKLIDDGQGKPVDDGPWSMDGQGKPVDDGPWSMNGQGKSVDDGPWSMEKEKSLANPSKPNEATIDDGPSTMDNTSPTMDHGPWTMDTKRSLNAILPKDIAIKNIFPVAADAHARFDAIKRSYEYHIHFNKDPFKNGYSWELRDKPDIRLMNEAAAIIMEYSDFSCFSKSNTQVKTNICKITKAEWSATDDGIIFTISADRFLRNMVRAIVGTLLMVGKREIEPEAVRQVIESKNRSKAGTSVPACGLYLTEVRYKTP